MTAPSENDDDEAGSKPLRVAVLCNGPHLAAWQVECLRHIQDLPFAAISLLIVNAEPPAPRPPAIRRLRNKLSNGLLAWRTYERFVLERRAAATKSVPLPPALEELPKVEVVPVKVGKFRQAFDDDALGAIRSHDPDVLLRFGFGILTGEILSLARYGLWSFHHGDPAHFRGAPPGFWEIHNGDPVTGVILQRLTETLDGGAVLHAGWFKTNAASYPKSLDRTFFGSAHFVARALTDLRKDPAGLLRRQPPETSGPIYRYPRTGAVLTFLAKSLRARFRDQYVSLFRHQQWSVGVIDRSVESLCAESSGSALEADGVRWLPESKGRFLADPFPLVGADGQAAIIAEDFSWKKNIGRISIVPLDSHAEPRAAIRSDFHLSYPFMLDVEDKVFCVPECAESREVALHRYDGKERRWEKYKTLVEGRALLDPTIFRHDDRWWLFCTDAERGPNEFLCAWYAEELAGEWRPHRANPIKVDIRSARPAGPPFMFDGAMIRPAQDCSRIYGGAISFNRTLKLTHDEFVEEPIGRLTPDRRRYPAGLHTIAGFGEKTIVDGARWTFVWDEFGRAVRRKLRGRA